MKSVFIKIYAWRAIFAVCIMLALFCFGQKAHGASDTESPFPEEKPIVTIKPHGVPRKLRGVQQEPSIKLPEPKSKDVKTPDEKSGDLKSVYIKPAYTVSADVTSSDKTPRETIDELLKELTATKPSKTPKPSLPPAVTTASVASGDTAPAPNAPNYSTATPKDGKFSWPVTGKVTSSYGSKRGRRRVHSGIDIPMPFDTPIGAAADGVVADTGSSKSKSYRGYGNTVVIDHGNGVFTLYAHCSKLAVKKGQRVKRGDVVAYVGRTGRTTTAHVHFEVRKNGKPVNPMPYLTAR
ncbi:hypothetical protein AGMMS50276_24000 [Synergistales bacterium]|nr:hypothetical protein AGMMS50276_24000 [Synergistales bacterium]